MDQHLLPDLVLTGQNLCGFHAGQELSGPSALDLMMQLFDVVAYGCQDALGQDVFPSPVQVLAEPQIFFDHSEASFRLDAAVHPQLRPVLCCYPVQRLLPLFLHDF